MNRLAGHALAYIFRMAFRLPFLKKRFFGFYTRVFRPFGLFRGVHKKVLYKKRLTLELDLEDWIPQNIYFLNAYETKEIDFVTGYLQPGGCFIDVGANIGLFSLAASLAVGGSGTVISFEPFERNYRQLLNHMRLNGCENVIAERLALADEPGSMELYLNASEKDFGMVTGYSKVYTYKEQVHKTTLDKYLQDNSFGFGSVTMIKIDIEGGEYPALLGMEKTLRKDKPLLLVEINPGNHLPSPDPLTQVEGYLAQLGYRKYHLNMRGNLTLEKESADDSNNYIFRHEGLGEVP